MSCIVLAFDIERAGATAEYDTIAIGASVVDENLKELDRLFLPGYIKNVTKFEPRCWDEFWSKNLDQLELIKYERSECGSELERSECGEDNEAVQKEMIENFQEFRAKWELRAKASGAKFQIVSDNNVFDGGFINNMIFKHLPGTLPLPYTASFPQEYSSFFETHSQQKGLLTAVDPEFKSDWGLSKRISELYNVPECTVVHDHHPCNDAYTIAYEQHVLNGIRDGRYKRC